MKKILSLLFLFSPLSLSEEIMKISIKSENLEVICKLNQSGAAKDLIQQLPMQIKVENYSSNEKIFQPKQKLNTAQTPLSNGKTYSFAYFAPWNNLVLFYKKGSPYPGLYDLGDCIEGEENIANLKGIIEIKAL